MLKLRRLLRQSLLPLAVLARLVGLRLRMLLLLQLLCSPQHRRSREGLRKMSATTTCTC